MFLPYRMASLGVCTLAAPPAGWLLSWQQLVPTTARWTSPWGWSIASRDASRQGKPPGRPGRHKFQEEEPGQSPRPGSLYWTDSEKQPLVGKGLSHRATVSQFQGSLIHTDLSVPERSFSHFFPKREEFAVNTCSQNSLKDGLKGIS